MKKYQLGTWTIVFVFQKEPQKTWPQSECISVEWETGLGPSQPSFSALSKSAVLDLVGIQ